METLKLILKITGFVIVELLILYVVARIAIRYNIDDPFDPWSDERYDYEAEGKGGVG